MGFTLYNYNKMDMYILSCEILGSFNIRRILVESSLIFRQNTEVYFTLAHYRCVSSSQS